MRAGTLRHRVSIQRLDGTRDAYGAENKTWVDVLTSLPASVKQIDGRELVSGQRVQAEATTMIRTRYFTNAITPKMRIYWPLQAKAYDILSIEDPDFRRREYQFVCKERIG